MAIVDIINSNLADVKKCEAWIASRETIIGIGNSGQIEVVFGLPGIKAIDELIKKEIEANKALAKTQKY